MALIAFGIMILGAADPRRPKAQQLAIAGILAFVSLLVLALIVIAVVDWFATATYGSRQRRALAEERLAVLEEEVRKLSASRGESNGKPKVNREV